MCFSPEDPFNYGTVKYISELKRCRVLWSLRPNAEWKRPKNEVVQQIFPCGIATLFSFCGPTLIAEMSSDFFLVTH